MLESSLMVKENLQRFIEAQNELIYETAVAELKAGRKQTHWMWFIFPQLIGLGQSDMSKYYGIQSLLEAEEYWNHPLLGTRLRECISIVNSLDKSAEAIFGEIDAQKFRSCLTLFLQINPIDDKSSLQKALQRFYGGQMDSMTLVLLAS